MYHEGIGVKKDYKIAKVFFEKAAEKQNPGAFLALGEMYYNGHGVRQDTAKAKEYYGLACDNGIQEGCDKYAILNKSKK
ncbi:MAG: sel1 repeat family protein [Desulfovibrio sp.]|nr:sel1 repeat family protein [Desulfovibrio sp.]